MPFYEKLKNDSYNLIVKDTGHANFPDFPLVTSLFGSNNPYQATIGSIDRTRRAWIINNYTLAFFDKYLKNQDEPLLNGPSPDYLEILFESRRVTSSDSNKPTFLGW